MAFKDGKGRKVSKNLIGPDDWGCATCGARVPFNHYHHCQFGNAPRDVEDQAVKKYITFIISLAYVGVVDGQDIAVSPGPEWWGVVALRDSGRDRPRARLVALFDNKQQADAYSQDNFDDIVIPVKSYISNPGSK
jgi:hypothetical protein